MSEKETLLPEALIGLEKKAFTVGVLATVLLGVGFFMNPDHFWQSYLTGYLFGIGAPLGCLAVLCIIHLAGGRWGYMIRRPLEAGLQPMWLMAILFIPIALWGMEDLYARWLYPETDPLHIVPEKVAYLNESGFMIRAVCYFVVWCLISFLLTTWSKKQDETGSLSYRMKLRGLAGPALMIHMLVITFASVDWAMSITPTWFSSIYGVLFAVGQGLMAWCFAILMLVFLKKYSPVKELFQTKDLHHLGSLLFGFVILWTYIELSQFIIIWSANLPEEIPWFLNRSKGAMLYLTVFLFAFHFVFPFFALLSRHVKMKEKYIAKMAILLVIMRIVDINWIIGPSVHQPITDPTYAGESIFTLFDVIAPIAFGGIWFGMAIRYLRKLPVVPTKDPVFTEGYTYTKEAN